MTRTLLLGFCFYVLLFAKSLAAAPDDGEVSLAGPLRIAKLLWKANPRSAADTLVGTITKALDRGHVEALTSALAPLQSEAGDLVAQADLRDPRYVPAVAIHVLLLSEPRTMAQEMGALLPRVEEPAARQLLLQVWFLVDDQAAFEHFSVQVVTNRNEAAAAALVDAAFTHHPAQAARHLLRVWNDLPPATKLAAIEPLTARPETMRMLIDAVAAERVSKDLVNTNQLRKWLQSPQGDLRPAIESVWGKIRESDNLARQKLVAQTLKLLRSGVSGNVEQGAAVFTRVCSQCHAFHGRGFEVGPNLAGNGRGSLQQLVSNVLDPSLVIGEAFQGKIVLTVDGEIVSGLVVAENDRYLKLKLQGGKTVEFDKQEDIEQFKTSAQSLMPEGVESQMTQQDLIDLFAYLCLVKPPEVQTTNAFPARRTIWFPLPLIRLEPDWRFWV